MYKGCIALGLGLVVTFFLITGCECQSKKYKCTSKELDLVNKEMQICKYGDSYCNYKEMKETHCSVVRKKRK